MPDVTISIGQKEFTVACREGEEPYLRAAAQMLDQEATSLVEQIGRLPESRMLLMAGLMLADRTAAYEERAREAEARLGEQERRIAELEAAARSDAASGGALPPEMVARLSGLVRRAEELAEDAEARRAM